ncbi:GNAT family N-acetyltransferase [Bacteroidota bacterium]
MGYRVVKIETKSLQRKFINLPWKIYRDDPHWVPPLRLLEKQHISSKHNPFLNYGKISLFGVLDDSGEMTGRIAAILNPTHNRLHGPEDGFFGLFECIKDLEVARLLIGAVEQELGGWGLSNLIGPVNFTTNDESGFLIDGFESSPSFMTNYCPKYYPNFMEELGFRKLDDLYAYKWTIGHAFPKRFETMAERVAGNPGISIRKFREKDVKAELKTVQNIYNQSFEGLRGFVPLNKEEIKEMNEGFSLFIDYDIILFGEYKGEPVGFCMTLPDLNGILPDLDGRLFPFGFFKLKRKLRSFKNIRLMVIAILPGYRNRGIVLLLIRQLVEEAVKKGYETCELSVIRESNRKMKGLIEALGFQKVKKYRIYSKKLDPPK